MEVSQNPKNQIAVEKSMRIRPIELIIIVIKIRLKINAVLDIISQGYLGGF